MFKNSLQKIHVALENFINLKDGPLLQVITTKFSAHAFDFLHYDRHCLKITVRLLSQSDISSLVYSCPSQTTSDFL